MISLLSNKMIIIAIITMGFYYCGDHNAQAEHDRFYQIEEVVQLSQGDAKIAEMAWRRLAAQYKETQKSKEQLHKAYLLMLRKHLSCENFENYTGHGPVYGIPKDATDYSTVEVLCYYEESKSE